MTELTGVAFDGAETGVLDNAVGQRRLAYAWGAEQECDAGFTGRGLSDPGQKSGVVVAVDQGAGAFDVVFGCHYLATGVLVLD